MVYSQQTTYKHNKRTTMTNGQSKHSKRVEAGALYRCIVSWTTSNKVAVPNRPGMVWNDFSCFLKAEIIPRISSFEMDDFRERFWSMIVWLPDAVKLFLEENFRCTTSISRNMYNELDLKSDYRVPVLMWRKNTHKMKTRKSGKNKGKKCLEACDVYDRIPCVSFWYF